MQRITCKENFGFSNSILPAVVPFFCLLPKFAAVFSGHSCNLYPRFFYIAIWIFCKILIGDTAAADLLAVHGTTQEDVKNVEEAKKGNLAWATMNTLPEADPACHIAAV